MFNITMNWMGSTLSQTSSKTLNPFTLTSVTKFNCYSNSMYHCDTIESNVLPQFASYLEFFLQNYSLFIAKNMSIEN